MAYGYRVVLDLVCGVQAPQTALAAGSSAAERALSKLGPVWLKRLQPFASRLHEDRFDELDASVLEFALFHALEAAFPETLGIPPAPLTRECFVLRI